MDCYLRRKEFRLDTASRLYGVSLAFGIYMTLMR